MLRMIISRYIVRQILQATSAVTIILLVVVVLGRLLNYLVQAADGELDRRVLVEVLAWRLPDFLQLILPLALLLGLLLTLGRLYADNEMTVLLASGVGPPRVLGISLVAAAVVAALVALFSLVLAPTGSREASALLRAEESVSEFDLLVPGVFQALGGSGRTVYTEQLDAGLLQQVFVHDAGNGRLIKAERAETVQNEQGERFVRFRHGTLTTRIAGSSVVDVTEFTELGLRLPPRQLAMSPDVRERSLPTQDLLGDAAPARLAELQWRLSLVLLVPIVTLLAVPLAKVSPRQGRFARLVPAILLYLLYLGLLLLSRSALGEGTLSPSVGLWWVHLLFLTIGLGLCARMAWPGRRLLGHA